MKNSWHYIDGGKFILETLVDKKVTHVVQDKSLARSGYCNWQGELDDDTYFLAQILDGVLMITIAEREMELKLKNPITVAYVHELKSVIELSNEVLRFQKMFEIREEFIPDFTTDLEFEEIMEIFIWKYASDKVEVYRPIL